jgi:hypothetical protein
MGRTTLLLGFFVALGISACDSDIVCPGHIDPRGPPTAIIRVADASVAITAAQVVEGPCTAKLYDGWADGALVVAGVSLSLRSDAGAGCLVEVFSSDGRCEVVAVTIATYASSPQYHCSDNSDCCGKAAVVSVTLAPYSTITPYATDLTFGHNPCPGYDGGAASVDGGALDVSMVDGEAIDRAID